MRKEVRLPPRDLPQGGQIRHDVRLSVGGQPRALYRCIRVRGHAHARLRKSHAVLGCISDARRGDDPARGERACDSLDSQGAPQESDTSRAAIPTLAEGKCTSPASPYAGSVAPQQPQPLAPPAASHKSCKFIVRHTVHARLNRVSVCCISIKSRQSAAAIPRHILELGCRTQTLSVREMFVGKQIKAG